MPFSTQSMLPDEYSTESRSGRWRYLDCLGEGGLATVFRAVDVTGPLGEVALKVLRPNARWVHAFELHREAQWSLTRLHCGADPRYSESHAQLFARYLEDHSGITGACTSHGCNFPSCETGCSFDSQRRLMEASDFNWAALGQRPTARPYVVIELLPGEALHLVLRTCGERGELPSPAPSGPLSHVERYTVLAQLAQACEYLQSFRLVHRDLRACNIQLVRREPTCEVRVLDLGVTIAAEEPLRCSANPAVRVFDGLQTAIGYDWLPWEIRVGGANFEWPVHAFDVFSLGVLWLQLVAGQVGASGALAQLRAGGEEWSVVVRRLPGVALCSVVVATLGQMLGPAAKRPTPGKVLEAIDAAATAAASISGSDWVATSAATSTLSTSLVLGRGDRGCRVRGRRLVTTGGSRQTSRRIVRQVTAAWQGTSSAADRATERLTVTASATADSHTTAASMEVERQDALQRAEETEQRDVERRARDAGGSTVAALAPPGNTRRPLATEAQGAAPADFTLGGIVQIEGLKSKLELNGMMAVLVERQGERWRVRLPNGKGDKLIRATNLVGETLLSNGALHDPAAEEAEPSSKRHLASYTTTRETTFATTGARRLVPEKLPERDDDTGRPVKQAAELLDRVEDDLRQMAHDVSNTLNCLDKEEVSSVKRPRLDTAAELPSEASACMKGRLRARAAALLAAIERCRLEASACRQGV